MAEDIAGPGRVWLAPAFGAGHGARSADLGVAEVQVAAALAVEGLPLVDKPPAEAALIVDWATPTSEVRPRVALVPDLEPTAAWRSAAERYAVVDERAAAALITRGVPVERIAVTGWPLAAPWREAAAADPAELRRRFDIDARGPVAIIDTRDLDEQTLAGLLLQLSLIDDLEPLFDAPDDDTAALLRARCPPLGLRARRFGVVPEAPLLWRAADIVVGRVRPASVAQARLLGLAVVALASGEEDLEAEAVAERGIGRRVTLSTAAAGLQLLTGPRLDAARAASRAGARPDAATACARLVADVVRRRDAILAEPPPRSGSPAAPGPAGPLEEVGIAPEEQREIAAERRAERAVEDRARRDIDDRLAALKARLKPGDEK